MAVSKVASTPRSSSSRTVSRSRNCGRRCHLGGSISPGALGLTDRLRRRVALGAQLVDLGLQRAPALVQGQHLVQGAVGLDDGRAPCARARCRRG